METRTGFHVASIALNSLIGMGILAMMASLPISAEEGPIPADQLARKKRFAKVVLFTGGGVAALAAFGRYAIDRPRQIPEKETRR